MFITKVYMRKMKSLPRTIPKLWPKLDFVLRHRLPCQNIDAPEFHSYDINNFERVGC